MGRQYCSEKRRESRRGRRTTRADSFAVKRGIYTSPDTKPTAVARGLCVGILINFDFFSEKDEFENHDHLVTRSAKYIGIFFWCQVLTRKYFLARFERFNCSNTRKDPDVHPVYCFKRSVSPQQRRAIVGSGKPIARGSYGRVSSRAAPRWIGGSRVNGSGYDRGGE